MHDLAWCVLQVAVTPASASRGLPVVQLSLDQALHQHQQLQHASAPLPACTNAPLQGAYHNGVALPNLHVEAEFRLLVNT